MTHYAKNSLNNLLTVSEKIDEICRYIIKYRCTYIHVHNSKEYLSMYCIIINISSRARQNRRCDHNTK